MRQDRVASVSTELNEETEMGSRRRLLAWTAGAGALLGAGGLAPTAAHTQLGKGLVGAWYAGFLPNDPPPGLQRGRILTQFSADENVTVATFPSILLPGGVRIFNTIGVGRWAKTGSNSFVYTYLLFILDENGQFSAQLKARQTVVLDATGDRFSGTFVREDTDFNGNVLLTREGTVEGQRVLAAP